MDATYVAAATNVYSLSIDMQGQTALAVTGTSVSGTVATTFSLEGSYDLQTWSTTGMTLPFTSIGASPGFSSGISLNIPYPYVRVKLTGGASATVVSVSCAAFEPT
jgi:hypothetical protein